MAPSHRRLTLGLLTLGLAGMAGAQTIPTFRLLHPSDVEQVTLSPSGERIAALTSAPDGNGLIVLQWRNGSVAAVLGNRLGNNRSFTSYSWLTDDFLLLHYTDYRQDEHQSLLVDVPRRTVHYLNIIRTVFSS